MSRCFTWLPNWLVLGEPYIYHNLEDFTRMWGFYLEGVWLVMPSEEASRQKCDKLLYVSMGGASVLPRGAVC